jgi:hypothetical protein
MLKVLQGNPGLAGLAIFAVWMFAVLPFLYGPPPRFSESSHKQESHSAQPDQQAKTEPRGTAGEPFFVQVLPAKKSAIETEEERRERDQKASNEWLLMVWTAILACVTVALVLVAGVQAAFFLVQLRYMRKGMDDAKMVAEATKVSADAALKSANTAEAALIANDRAWISINAEPIGPLVFEKDRIHIGIGFDLKNVGKSPATHLEIQAELCADIIVAKNKGDDAVKWNSRSLFDMFGVVLFPDQEREYDLLEMQMPAAKFRDAIEATKTELAKQDSPEWDGTTANPGIMVCATYRLAGSRKSRHTVVLFEVRHIDEKHMGWDGGEGETGLVYLKLVQTFMSGQVT